MGNFSSLKKYSEKLFAELRDQVSEKISHYTSIDAFRAMINDNKILVSSVLHMNDGADGSFFFNKFIEKILLKIEDSALRNRLLQRFDLEMSYGKNFQSSNFQLLELNVEHSQLSPLDDFLNYLFHFIFSVRRQSYVGFMDGHEIYIASFVNSQAEKAFHWMSYGSDGKGLKIDFDSKVLFDFFEKNKPDTLSLVTAEDSYDPYYMHLVKCQYIKEEDLDIICENILESILIDNENHVPGSILNYFNFERNFCDVILKISSVYKSEYFKEEDECRFLCSGVFSDKVEKFYLNGDNSFKPRISYPFPGSALKNITVGSRCDPRLPMGLENFLNYNRRKKQNDDDLSALSDQITIDKSRILYFGK